MENKAFKKGRGRPKIISPEITKKICDFIRIGCYVETAAACADISKETFYDWMRQGARQKAGPFKDFSDAVNKAVHECEARDLTRLENLANKEDYRAITWRLERKFPKKWGKKEIIRVEDETTKDSSFTENINAILVDILEKNKAGNSGENK